MYALDIYTAATMIASSTWTNVIYRKCGNDCAIKIPFDIAKWVFVGCIAFGFLLVGLERNPLWTVFLMRLLPARIRNLEGKKSHQESGYRASIYLDLRERLLLIK